MGSGCNHQKLTRNISAELRLANQELAHQNEEKEKRAAELAIANTELVHQNEEKEKRAVELAIANTELVHQNAEKEKRAAELAIANTELLHQNAEKEKRAAELAIANTELAHQNEEKEKRAAELAIANTELAHQNDEKEKRAAELAIANTELAHQNDEKEKRAAELAIANTELAHQNDEKEKRAAELAIANTELAHQNGEKEKRAAELAIANTELLHQNGEKEKRAAELAIANTELAHQNKEKIKRAAELLVSQKEIIAQAELIKILESYYIDKQIFEATLLSIGDALISCDINGNIIFVNKVAEQLSGWMQTEVIGKPFDMIFHFINAHTRTENENIIRKVISDGKVISLASDCLLLCKDGSEKYVEDSAAPIFQKNGNLVGAVLVFRDITDKIQRLEAFQFLSNHDKLTGLYNRRYYEEEIERMNTESNLPLTIALGDINGLKLVNDSFGHRIGDELIKTTADAMKTVSWGNGIVARLGGDEFVIMLPNTDTDDVESMIQRIKDALMDKRINGVEISISFGYKTKYDMVTAIDETFKNAEDAMYRQKLYESSSMRGRTVDLIMNTLYEKNHREMHHSIRVGEICGELSKAMGFSDENVHKMRLAGKLHDIGKIAIDENILNKAGRITNEEFGEMKRHSEIGFRILCSVNEFSEIASYVLSHHERWDGLGYPKGIKGKEISIQAGIIAVADSYDAMVSERTYKKALSIAEASAEIRRCSGTQFNPNVVEIFLNRVEKSLLSSIALDNSNQAG